MRRGEGGSTTASNPHILVVDDEPYTRQMLEEALARRGYECVTASGALEAAYVLEREDFDLLLLDSLMPGKSGMDLLSAVAEYPYMPVVMMIGVADAAAVAKALRAGACDCVTKPVDLEELGARLEHALARRALILQDHTKHTATGEFTEPV